VPDDQYIDPWQIPLCLDGHCGLAPRWISPEARGRNGQKARVRETQTNYTSVLGLGLIQDLAATDYVGLGQIILNSTYLEQPSIPRIRLQANGLLEFIPPPVPPSNAVILPRDLSIIPGKRAATVVVK